MRNVTKRECVTSRVRKDARGYCKYKKVYLKLRDVLLKSYISHFCSIFFAKHGVTFKILTLNIDEFCFTDNI